MCHNEYDLCYICGNILVSDRLTDCFGGTLPIYNPDHLYDICQKCEKVVEMAKQQMRYSKNLNKTL